MRETPKAALAWADYLALGPERSFDRLLERYQSATNPPTRRRKSLADWSSRYGWQQRLADIAAAEAEAAAEREAAYRRTIMEEGYGLGHERVRTLKAVAERLADFALEMALPNADSRLLKAVLSELRGALAEIAKEKGERVTKSDVTLNATVQDATGLSDDERTRRLRLLLARVDGEAPG